MKILFKIIMVVVFSIAILVSESCQKQVTDNRPNIPVTEDDSTLLVKYLEIQSFPGDEPDTTIIKYSYDASGRLTEVYTVFSSDPVDNFNHFDRNNYFYVGTDTLPYKFTTYSQEIAGSLDNTFKDTVYYSFNANGDVIEDSIRSYNGSNPVEISKSNYDYRTGYIIRTRTATAVNVDTVKQSYINGNLISQNALFDQANGEGIFDFIYSYDTHPNPFNILADNKIRFIELFESANYTLAQKNNPLTTRQTLSRSGIISTTNVEYIYTYKSNGYPFAVEIKYDSNPSYTKGFFEYGVR